MDWFYHAPRDGRVGPLSAAELREHYRDRRIERDTLVWRAGLPEWQPLERLADEVDLFSVVPDTRLPPPLPATSPATMHPRSSTAPGRGGASVAPVPKRMNGCLIALIVLAVVSIPLVAILAAVALPAYQDYTVRAKTAAFLAPRTQAMQAGLLQARETLGQCPVEPVEAGVTDPATATSVTVGTLDDGRCAFEVTVTGVHTRVDGRRILYIAPPVAGGVWDCTGGDLPAPYRPPACRGPATGTNR